MPTSWLRWLRRIAIALAGVVAALAFLWAVTVLWPRLSLLWDSRTVIAIEIVIAIAALALLAGIWWLWWRLPKRQVRGLDIQIHDPKDRADTEDNFRKTAGQALGGAAVLIGAVVAYLQFTQQQQASHDLLISNQVAKGFEQLAARDNLTMRLGGIYALEGVMNTSEQYHAPVLEALCAFVRDSTTGKASDKSATDIHAALHVIGRRKPGPGNVNLVGANIQGADLSDADVSDADISGADLSDANLLRANLSRAQLSGINLSRTILSGADLHRANFGSMTLSYSLGGDFVVHFNRPFQLSGGAGAKLVGAVLFRANLSHASLSGADLSGADLDEAELSNADLNHTDLNEARLIHANLSGSFLGGANLSRALLRDAKLGGAKLGGANLTDADLSGADLRGAYLADDVERLVDDLERDPGARSGALLDGANLTDAKLDGQSQLDQACGTDAKLPSGLTLKPCHPSRLHLPPPPAR